MKSTAPIQLLCLTWAHAMTPLSAMCPTPCDAYATNDPLIASQCGTFSGQIETLYYKAGNELTPYTEHSIPEYSHESYRVKHLEYDWDAGFRATVGYHLPQDRWHLCASWLHYDNKTSIQKDTSWNQGLGSYINMHYGIIPVRIQIPTTEPTTRTHGQATARLSIHEVALEVDREYYVGTWVTLTPKAGLKASFITSRYTQQYQVFSRQDTVELETIFQSKTDFKAAGIGSGLDSSWLLGCGLSLYAQAYASLYYSGFEIVEMQDEVRLLKEQSIKQFQTLTYQLDYGLGVRWRSPFDCSQRLFCIHLGWEGKYLPEMNRIAESEQTSRAPLILHGLCLGAWLTY